MIGVGWLGLIIVALASYRLTRVFTSDSLTEVPRIRLYQWAWDEEHREALNGDWVPKSRGALRTYVYELLTCPFCLGLWISALLYSLWRWVDWMPLHAGITILAIAGVQGFIASRNDA